MTTDAEKLAQIAALCDDARRVGFHTIYTSSVRRIIEEPNPAIEGVTLTPEEADFLLSELNGMLEQYGESPDPDEQQTNFYRRALAARLEAVAA